MMVAVLVILTTMEIKDKCLFVTIAIIIVIIVILIIAIKIISINIIIT